MRKHPKALLVVSTIIVGIVAGPAIYADDSGGGDGSMMGRGMMGQGGMMGQMTSMMEGCNDMMQAMMENEHGARQPNEQWQERSPQHQDQLQPEDNAD
jgi:hypothetical protein